MKHLKEKCAGCERTGVNYNKEHVFPKWLILRTNTNNTKIRWGDKKIPALSCTIPLCRDCNKAFGKHLESPVKLIFDNLEKGAGISDLDAELLVRWLWKLEGLFWHIGNPEGKYSIKYSLRDRVLKNIDEIRSELFIAISLIKNIDATYGDRPMGIDSHNLHSALFVSGVFSKVAIMTGLNICKNLIPQNYSIYNLEQNPEDSKFFFPKEGFYDDTEAVSVSIIASTRITKEHDNIALLVMGKKFHRQ